MLRRSLCPTLIAAVLSALAAPGCRSAPSRGSIVQAVRSQETDRVSRVVVLWSEAALRQDGVPVAQGFTAKVYLYGPDSEQPVAGRGKLTVYAYNDSEVRQGGSNQYSPKPDRSWEFTESELRGSLKKDLIGTYCPLWLPCGPPVAAEQRYTLMLGFTPSNAPPVLSESALVTLTPSQSARRNGSVPTAAKNYGSGNADPQELKL